VCLGCGQGDTGEMALVRRVKAHDAPITAVDVSASGAFLGTGSSEGASHLSTYPSEACRHGMHHQSARASVSSAGLVARRRVGRPGSWLPVERGSTPCSALVVKPLLAW